MLSHRAKRIALIFVGAVAIAACGGSSTSTPESPTTLFQKNGSLLTAKKQYTGVISASEYEGDTTKDYSKASIRNGDKFAYSFDVDLAAVDANALAPGATDSYNLETDFRGVFSNFKLMSLDGNLGTANLSKIKWSKCPPKVEVRPKASIVKGANTTTVQMLRITFFDESANSATTVNCSPNFNVLPSTASLIVQFYNYSASGTSGSWELPNSPQPVFSNFLPKGFDTFPVERNIQTNVYFRDGTDSRYHSMNAKSLSSKIVKDYSPFALVATADAAGVTAQWNRSVDLGPDDAATHVVEVSKDNFTTTSETKLISQDTNMTTLLPSCEIDPNNTMRVGTSLSLRVKALDADGISSSYTDIATVVKTSDNLVCPTATLSAPTEVQAKLDIPTRQYTVEWNAVADAGDVDLTYCIETSNDSFETKNEDNKFCVGDATQSTLDWKGQDSLAFRVVAVSANGVVSQPSGTAVVKLPDPQSVSNVMVAQVQDGLQFTWNAAKQTGGLSNASHLVKWGLLKGEKREPESGGFALGDVISHVIPRADWEKIALPGSKLWVDVSSCTEAACAKPVSATFAFPEAEVKDLPVETIVESTIPTDTETTTVAVTTNPSKQTSVTTSTVATMLNSGFGCYIRGNIRSCGNYVLQFVK